MENSKREWPAPTVVISILYHLSMWKMPESWPLKVHGWSIRYSRVCDFARGDKTKRSYSRPELCSAASQNLAFFTLGKEDGRTWNYYLLCEYLSSNLPTRTDSSSILRIENTFDRFTYLQLRWTNSTMRRILRDMTSVLLPYLRFGDELWSVSAHYPLKAEYHSADRLWTDRLPWKPVSLPTYHQQILPHFQPKTLSHTYWESPTKSHSFWHRYRSLKLVAVPLGAK